MNGQIFYNPKNIDETNVMSEIKPTKTKKSLKKDKKPKQIKSDTSLSAQRTSEIVEEDTEDS